MTKLYAIKLARRLGLTVAVSFVVSVFAFYFFSAHWWPQGGATDVILVDERPPGANVPGWTLSDSLWDLGFLTAGLILLGVAALGFLLLLSWGISKMRKGRGTIHGAR